MVPIYKFFILATLSYLSGVMISSGRDIGFVFGGLGAFAIGWHHEWFRT